MVTQVAAGMLTGNATGTAREATTGNPTLVVAWPIEMFAVGEDFYRQVQEFAREMRAFLSGSGV